VPGGIGIDLITSIRIDFFCCFQQPGTDRNGLFVSGADLTRLDVQIDVDLLE
jgi:hypothetical protein